MTRYVGTSIYLMCSFTLSFQKRDKVIKALNKQLRHGELTVEDFLIRLTLAVEFRSEIEADSCTGDDTAREDCSSPEAVSANNDERSPRSALDIWMGASSPEIRLKLRLADDFMCIICVSTRREILVKPCCHLTLCAACWKKYEKFHYPRDVNCPVCKMEVTEVQRVFTS